MKKPQSTQSSSSADGARSLRDEFARWPGKPTTKDGEIVALVDRLLAFARDQRASDLHLIPASLGELQALIRVDGVLHPIAEITQAAPQVVARLKVLAGLLTYRTDVPQEGRIRTGESELEMRVSTFPTVHGEKAVVRLFVGSGHFRQLGELGFPDDVDAELQRLLLRTSGLFIVCGPAGSGKTTTLYASLRQIQQASITPRSLCTLEDPVEALLPGVSQSQVKPEGEFTYERGLASLMRQDPEVIMVGEIRDRGTAEVVFQAALTGHFVLTSFHAASAADAISRLSDMQIEPYVLRTGLNAVLSQRLVRRLCECQLREDAACASCRGAGYRGRLVLAELLLPDLQKLGRSILNRDDASRIEQLAVESGMITLRERGREAVANRLTSPEELVRVFGPAISTGVHT